MIGHRSRAIFCFRWPVHRLVDWVDSFVAHADLCTLFGIYIWLVHVICIMCDCDDHIDHHQSNFRLAFITRFGIFCCHRLDKTATTSTKKMVYLQCVYMYLVYRHRRLVTIPLTSHEHTDTQTHTRRRLFDIHQNWCWWFNLAASPVVHNHFYCITSLSDTVGNVFVFYQS